MADKTYQLDPQTEKAPEKKISLVPIFLSFFLLIAALVGLIILQEKLNPKRQEAADPLAQGTSSVEVLEKLTATDRLPELTSDSWELVLVNSENVKEELNPELAEVPETGIMVDRRIADATASFLAAAQAVDPYVHLITGYRSVEEQTAIYETYVQQEMAARGIEREAAETVVRAYFQAPGTSEHMTGLAIDMSTVDYLNLMDANVASQLAAMAPEYGFVLRYKASHEPQTGMPYEDWHFRYVGPESARYMTDYDLALETYLIQLENKK